MKRRMLAIAMTIVMLLGLFPTSAFAAEGEDTPAPAVVYGTYDENGAWTQGAGTGTYTDEETGVTLSKTAAPTNDPNVYEVTLQVVTSTTETTTLPGAAATVLVIDVSGSMRFCAECGSSTSVDGEYRHDKDCELSTGETIIGGGKNQITVGSAVKTDETRLYAAKAAAISFLNSYKGTTSGTGRYVSVVKFSDGASVAREWVDVSTTNGYNKAEKAIKDLKAGGGTNLERGLYTANTQLTKDAVKNIPTDAKNVIVLTDGIPTYYGNNQNGPGSIGCPDVNDATAATAATLRKNATVYTVCFGAVGQKCWNDTKDCDGCDKAHSASDAPTVDAFLEKRIASSSDHAYSADNTDGLNDAFEAITDTITSGLDGSGMKVSDPMAPGVTAGIEDLSDVMTEDSNEDGFTWNVGSTQAEVETNGSVTTYTYTITYTVTLDPTEIDNFNEDAYYPLNRETTLTIPGEDENIVLNFEVPGVKGVLPTYTVTYDCGDHGTLAGQNDDGQVVHENRKYGTATPEAPAVTPDDGYYFTGWDKEIAATVTGNVTYTAQYAPKQAITVTANSDTVTYDGTEHSVSGYTVSPALPRGYELSGLTVSGASGTDAGTYGNTISGAAVITDDDGNDVTDHFKVDTVDGALTIVKRDVTLTSATDSKEYDGTPLTNHTVTVTGDGFVSGEVSKVEATGSVTYAGESETNTIVITPGDGYKESNYNITKSEGTLSITNRNAKYEITVEANSATEKYDGTEKSVSGLKQTTFTVNGQTFTVSGLSASAKGTDAGTYTANVTGTAVVTDAKGNDVTAQFIVNRVSGELKINPRAVTLTSETATKEYNGTPLTRPDVTVGGDGFVSGQVSDIKATGSVTYAGETVENTITYTKEAAFKESNYVITENVGTLTITNRDAKYEIEVVANSGTEKYDGTEKTVTGFQTLQVKAANGLTYTVSGLTASGSGTDAGTYTVSVTGTYKVTDAKGVDVTAQFDVTATPGTLTINKRQVTLTSGSGKKEYDGLPLTNGEVTVSGDGFANGEGASYTVTGTRTLEGTSKNAFTYTLNADTKAGNYDITTIEGQLTILNRTAKYQITVEANSGTEKYDGTEKTVSGLKQTTFTVNGQTYTVEGLSAERKATDAGEYTVSVEGTPVVKDAEGNDVTAQFAVSTEAGKLIIEKRSVTLTSATDSKEYDGTPLTNHEITVGGDGWAEGEGATYTVTGSQKRSGSSSNAFTYALNAGTSADNYEITKSEGTLTVTNRTVKYEITVEANSATGKYDGTEKSVSGLKQTTFTVNGQTFTVSGLTASAKGTDAGTYPAEVTGTAVVKDADGFDVTDQFIVNKVSGELKINPRAVTLTSATATKEYDGTPLTNDKVTVGGDGFVTGEVSDIKATGSVTYAGDIASNTITYKKEAAFKDSNYVITENVGQLSITNRNAKYQVEVVANSGEFLYDGTEKSVSGLVETEFTVNGQKYTVSGLAASGSGTDAGTYTVGVTGTAVVRDAKGVDVTAQFAVTATPGTLTINKRQVTLTSGSGEKEYDGLPLTNSKVTVGGDGWASGEGASYTVTGTRTLEGTSKNAFTYTLNAGTKAGNYDITTIEGQLTILNRTAKYQITVEANSGTEKYDGTEKSVSGFKTLEFTVNGVTFTVEGLTAERKATDAGTYTVNVVGTPVVKDAKGNDVTAQFAVTATSGTLTIEKRVVTLTSATDSKEYDGTPLTNHKVTVGGDGWADGEGATYTVTGSQKRSGSSSNAFTYALNAGTSADNYEITKSEGTLTVTNRTVKYEITVEANSGTEKYDGTEKSVSGLKQTTFTVNGQTFTVSGLTASAKGTDAGTYPAEVTGTAVVKDADGFDVTDQFIVNRVNGTLTINKRQVTLTSATDSKEYDGTALTNGEVTVSGDKFADGEGATYNVTGSQLITGSSANSFTYELNVGTNADNYVITTSYGTLTVTNRETKYEITVVANSKTEKYDGTEKSVSGLVETEFTVNGQKYTVSGLSAGASGTDAGEYTANVVGTPVVRDADGNDVTSEFTVKTTAGKLTIEKRVVTLTSATDSKEYDGLPLTNSKVTVGGDGFAEGEGADYDVTGTRTVVGTSENIFTYTLKEGTNADNYVITTSYGTLTVTNRDAKYQITVEANSGEFTYDGTEKTVSGLKQTVFTVNGQTYTVEGLSAERKATDAGTYTVNVVGTPVVKDAAGNDVTAQFAVSTKAGTLQINKRSVTLISESAYKPYDGTALERPDVTVTGDGFVEGEVTEIKAIGSVTYAGSAANTIVYTTGENFKAENYTITKREGVLTIIRDQNAIVITANSNEKTYDGTALTDAGYTVIGEVAEGDVLTAVVTGAQTDAGSSANVVTSYKVMRGDVDVTANYGNVTTADGTLTVTPAVITVTADDQSKVVGEPLPELTYTVASGVESETPAFTGELAYVGDDTRGVHTDEITQGTLALTDGQNFKASNYTLVFVPGTLTIHARGLQVEKTVDKTQARVGDMLVYTITVTNTGDVELTDVVITDPMLNMEKNIGSLAPGQVWSERFTYEVKSADGGKTIVNTVIAKAADGTEDEAVSPGTEVTKPSTGGGGSTVLNTKDHYSYIIGYKDGNVRPYGTVSRGEVATIFFRLLTDEARDKYWSQENDYSDCGPDLWCNNAISTLSNMGIIDGYSDGTFRPYAKITRAQFAKIAVGFFETTTKEYQGYFADVDADAWYTDYVEAAARVGLIQGFQDGTFRPNENITRAQACVIVNRALNRTPNAERLLPVAEMITWPDCTADDWFYADMQEATNSHDYTMVTVKGEKVEKWSAKLPQRDWAAFEHAWSTAHSAPGGEVVK